MNNNMSFRLRGLDQQERMIRDKQLSLKKATQYSYQGAKIRKYTDDTDVEYPALINRNKLIDDYDEKIISIDFSYNIQAGDIIVWKREVDTNWLVYLQDLTELAYFKARARRCNYTIKKYNAQGQIEELPVAVVGPSNSLISSVNKGHTSLDIPNYTITILAPKNKETLEYFKRYTKFYLQGQEPDETPVCWRVESIDSISIPGILELYAKEYYINDDTDIAVIDNETHYIADNGIQHIQVEENSDIQGAVTIKPMFEYTYTYVGDSVINGKFTVDDDDGQVNIIESNENKIVISWKAMYSGSFTLYFKNDNDKVISNKVITVESLF